MFAHSRRTFGAATAAALVLGSAVPALALSVTVNGQATTFNPPPIERAGRVFVPLRGVFERLGATVVYQSGVINATGNNTTISLKIGSSQAMVGGQPKTLDAPPFIVGASTYVPLRFVSEALGAGVNFDGTNQIVALTTSGSAPAPQGAQTQPLHLLRQLEPARAGFVGSTRPTISANFAQTVDPNSVHVSLDGVDVTANATRSASGFIYAPPSPLQSMEHDVVVTGSVQGGQAFTDQWKFTSGSQRANNMLELTSPGDGAGVGSNFVVRGRTLPNALVHIVAGATGSVGGMLSFGAGNYAGDTVADGNGNFSQQVSMQTIQGAQIGLTVTSTDPQSKASAEKKLRLRAQ